MHTLKFMFKPSNNETEYEALIAEIKLCYTASADSVRPYVSFESTQTQEGVNCVAKFSQFSGNRL